MNIILSKLNRNYKKIKIKRHRIAVLVLRNFVRKSRNFLNVYIGIGNIIIPHCTRLDRKHIALKNAGKIKFPNIFPILHNFVLNPVIFLEFLTITPSFAIGKISDVLSQIGKMNCNKVFH